MSNNLPKGFHKISDSSSPVVDVTSLDLSLLTGERGDGILVKEPYNPDVVVDGGKKKKRGRPRKEETAGPISVPSSRSLSMMESNPFAFRDNSLFLRWWLHITVKFLLRSTLKTSDIYLLLPFLLLFHLQNHLFQNRLFLRHKSLNTKMQTLFTRLHSKIIVLFSLFFTISDTFLPIRPAASLSNQSAAMV